MEEHVSDSFISRTLAKGEQQFSGIFVLIDTGFCQNVRKGWVCIEHFLDNVSPKQTQTDLRQCPNREGQSLHKEGDCRKEISLEKESQDLRPSVGKVEMAKRPALAHDVNIFRRLLAQEDDVVGAHFAEALPGGTRA
jgi:hypothetical protein